MVSMVSMVYSEYSCDLIFFVFLSSGKSTLLNIIRGGGQGASEGTLNVSLVKGDLNGANGNSGLSAMTRR